MLIRLMGSDDHVSGPINLEKPGEFTILEPAEKVIELSNSKSEKVFKKLPTDDPKQRRPDITQARKILEWEPEVELEFVDLVRHSWFLRRE